MATQTLAVSAAVLQFRQSLPATFQEALTQRWAVVSDKSALSANQQHRNGKITMQKPGFPGLLEVDYIGTPKSYRFSVPKYIAR